MQQMRDAMNAPNAFFSPHPQNPLVQELVFKCWFLVQIEETILESGVWKANSVLWETIIQTEGDIPKCEDVTLPYQFDKEDAGNGGGAPPQLTSPVMHPALRRIACEKSAVIPKKGEERGFPLGVSFLWRPLLGRTSH